MGTVEIPIIYTEVLLRGMEPLILVAFKTEKVAPVSIKALTAFSFIYIYIYFFFFFFFFPTSPKVLEQRSRKTSHEPSEQPYSCLT